MSDQESDFEWVGPHHHHQDRDESVVKMQQLKERIDRYTEAIAEAQGAVSEQPHVIVPPSLRAPVHQQDVSPLPMEESRVSRSLADDFDDTASSTSPTLQPNSASNTTHDSSTANITTTTITVEESTDEGNSQIPEEEETMSSRDLPEQVENAFQTLTLLNRSAENLSRQFYDGQRRRENTENANESITVQLQQCQRNFEEVMGKLSKLKEEKNTLPTLPSTMELLTTYQSAQRKYNTAADSCRPFFEQIRVVQGKIEQRENEAREKIAEIEKVCTLVDIKRQKIHTLEYDIARREKILQQRQGNLNQRREAAKKTDGHLQDRLDQVVKKEQHIAQWMRILENRDREMAEKEQLLHHHFDDVVKREKRINAEKENLLRQQHQHIRKQQPSSQQSRSQFLHHQSIIREEEIDTSGNEENDVSAAEFGAVDVTQISVQNTSTSARSEEEISIDF